MILTNPLTPFMIFSIPHFVFLSQVSVLLKQK